MRARTGGLSLLLLIGLFALVAAPAIGAHAQGLPGGDWQPAAGALGDNTIEGFIDQPASGANIAAGGSFGVSGWVVDTTAEGWSGVDDVQVLLGSTLLTHAGVGTSRPDVANALGNPFFGSAGFSGVVATALPAGPQTLTIVAHTPGRGSWSKQVTINLGGGGTATTGVAASGLVLRIIAPTSDDLISS